MSTEDRRPPHSGLRVLEFARILAGPWAGQILADLGAEVIKVESLDGDDTRQWGPPFITNADGGRDAAYFHAANRGKRSVMLDFGTAEGRAAACELAREADVVIENFKVGGLARFGLDYPSLARINLRLVYCSITGFGQDGPYAARPGYDFVIQGMSGIMDRRCQKDCTASDGGARLVECGHAPSTQTRQSVPVLSFVTRGHPPRGDDVCPLPAVAAER